jgi:hypothetical protein
MSDMWRRESDDGPGGPLMVMVAVLLLLMVGGGAGYVLLRQQAAARVAAEAARADAEAARAAALQAVRNAQPAGPAAASYRYEVRGAGGAVQRGESGEFSLTVGSTAVSVRGGRPTVNGKGYGLLKDGDSIRVDEDGQVTVNGAPRPSE